MTPLTLRGRVVEALQAAGATKEMGLRRLGYLGVWGFLRASWRPAAPRLAPAAGRVCPGGL